MTLIDRQSARTAHDLRRALSEPFGEVTDADPVLVFERFLAAKRKRSAEALIGGKAAPRRLARLLAGLSSPCDTPLGHVRVTDAPRHLRWPVDLGGPGPFLEVRSEDGTLVAREVAGLIEAVWLDGPLPFGDRRLSYRPRSELEGAEALTAVAAPFDLAYLRTDEERRNDRFPSPPDLEAAWRLGRVLDDLLDGGGSATLLDETFSAAQAREADVIGDWARRTGVAALLVDAAERARAAGGTLVFDEGELSASGREVRLTSAHGVSLRASVTRARRGEVALDVLAWDGRWRRLAITAGGAATEVPPFDVLLDVVVELGAVEAELNASVH